MTNWEVFVDDVSFAEGPRWRDGYLWYSDFYHHTVYRVSEAGLREPIVKVPNQPSGLGWLPDGDLLIVSMIDRKVLRFGAELTEHADLSEVATFHCNDMVVDAVGNAYVGNFGFDLEGGAPNQPADLALVRPDGSIEVVASGMEFANGSVITGNTLIVGESFGSRYSAFDIEPDATLSNRRTWAEMPGMAPDGCDLDAEGAIWFADAIGNQVVRVLEGGEITHTLSTDSGCFACQLGGSDGRTLYALTSTSSGPDATGQIVSTRVDIPKA
jgi:sugar lactone lactonase YvrE